MLAWVSAIWRNKNSVCIRGSLIGSPHSDVEYIWNLSREEEARRFLKVSRTTFVDVDVVLWELKREKGILRVIA